MINAILIGRSAILIGFMGQQTNSLNSIKLGTVAAILLWGTTFASHFVIVPVWAQTTQISPLESNPSDPLLPPASQNRPLSPLEIKRLTGRLDELKIQGESEFAVGNQDQAFTIWYREIRLRRVLGTVEEVQALGRVGDLAWQETRKADAQLITKRLETIEEEASNAAQLDLELLLVLGRSYEQLRIPEQAARVYEKILADAQQREDIGAQYSALNTLGSLYLAWFNYSQAADVYQQLLNLAQEQFDESNETIYLEELAYIYDKTFQTQAATSIKEQLVARYQQKQKLQLLPKLQISLADNYDILAQPEAASENYQQAFNLAWSLQQFNYAGEALEKLAALYHNYGEPVYAVQIYQELLTLEKQSYNLYAQMSIHDHIGKIYLEENDYSQALEAFQAGLDLASFLGYQQAYFQSQVETVNQQLERQIIPN